MLGFDRVTFDPGVMGGRACIRGMRITVSLVVNLVAAGASVDEILQERQEDRRPILTYNLMPSFTRQITNRIRQERPQVKVTPVETNRGRDPRLGLRRRAGRRLPSHRVRIRRPPP